MRSTRAANPGTDRPPFECRVRFPDRLTGAALVSPDAPLPPLKPRAVSPPPPTAPPPPPAPPPNPADFYKSEIARELQADRERIEAALGRIQQAVAGYREDQANRLREWQQAAVELASTITARVLHEQIAAGDFPVEAKVRDMLAQLEGNSPATVYLHPDDLELLESRLGGEPLLSGRTDPRLAPDSTLGRGDCRVESQEGMLLSEVTQELGQIRDDLLRSLGHARS